MPISAKVQWLGLGCTTITNNSSAVPGSGPTGAEERRSRLMSEAIYAVLESMKVFHAHMNATRTIVHQLCNESVIHPGGKWRDV
jgi:hypothetical protein